MPIPPCTCWAEAVTRAPASAAQNFAICAARSAGRSCATSHAACQVVQRMADGFIAVEAIRWTTWHAAWLIAQGRPADRAARIAKFWAAEAGARIAATTQHVHGGIGIDTTYPLHRYFLWAKHNELALGSATAQLARLGTTYARGQV